MWSTRSVFRNRQFVHSKLHWIATNVNVMSWHCDVTSHEDRTLQTWKNIGLTFLGKLGLLFHIEICENCRFQIAKTSFQKLWFSKSENQRFWISKTAFFSPNTMVLLENHGKSSAVFTLKPRFLFWLHEV